MTSSTPVAAEAAPPKPPRPSGETQKTEDILKEAFPSIDISVVKAVLRASGGKIDPAFNALLGMCRVTPHRLPKTANKAPLLTGPRYRND